MTSSFFRIALTLCFLAVSGLLGGCARQPAWMNPSSWFGPGTLAQPDEESQTRKGPPAPPQAAPVPPVQRLPATQQPAAPIPTAAATRVGLLLPLSGANGPLGQAMLNAAQQAVFDVAATNFELMPRDTGSNEDQSETAAKEVIAGGAQLLVGPLFAANVPSVSRIATAMHIPMLALSTDTTLAEPGLYVMGFAPEAQVERVVTFAASKGLRRFAAIIPSTPYGALVGKAFQSAVARNGGTVIALETYDPQRGGSDAAVRALIAMAPAMDALFLPEGGADLNQIANALVAARLDPHAVRLLGTGLWDTPDLARQTPFVAGGWYAAPDPAARQRFMDGFEAAYGQKPPRLATLAYDATAMAAVLAKRGMALNTASLTNPNGFAGLDGVFRLRPQGTVERGLAVLEVAPDSARVIEAAPSTFAGAGPNR